MEIDHFNPRLKGSARHDYDNLFLATRHCNGAKSDTWPSKSARKKGVYILNPCHEMDYGVHIFEHPVTHRLVGVTPAGDFHITTCDLNARHLVDERRERAQIHQALEGTGIKLKGGFDKFPSAELTLLQDQLSKMIPLIPYLPKNHPGYDEDLRLVQMLSTQV